MRYPAIKHLAAVILACMLSTTCSDLDLARDAAEATVDMKKQINRMEKLMKLMNEQMKNMQSSMQEMKLTTEQMQTLMQKMEEKMGAMNSNMQEMLLVMVQMNNMMNQMDIKVGDVLEKMEAMFGLMKHLGDAGKQGISRMIRQQTWEALENPKAKIETKLSLATIYYYAYEYQVASAEDLKDTDIYQTLLYQAAQEFYHQTYPLASQNKWSLDMAKKGNEANMLFALSLALHKVNPKFQATVSFEDMMKDALATNSGYLHPQERATIHADKLDKHIKEGIMWRKLALYFMQLRHNFIAGVVMQKISDLDETSQYKSLIHLGAVPDFWNKYQKISKPWSIHKAASNNVGLVEKMTEYANRANSVMDFLHCRGYTVKHFSKLKKMVGYLNTEDTQFADVIRDALANHQKSAEEFVLSITTLKDSVAKYANVFEQRKMESQENSQDPNRVETADATPFNKYTQADTQQQCEVSW